MDLVSVFSSVIRVAVAIAIALLVVTAYRAIRRRSRVIAAIVAASILIRTGGGLALFWISYLRLPLARSQQAGEGFWTLAIDATTYFRFAASAAQSVTLIPLDHLIPSPLFIDVLAIWMMLVGTSVAAAMFLNLCLYTALVVALVWTFKPRGDWRHDLPCIVGVAAYSFSPTVLIHSTQPLKDELSAVVLAFGCLGVLILGRAVRQRVPADGWGLAMRGSLIVGGATFAMAGIRWYMAAIVWSVLALVLTVGAFIRPRMPLRAYLAMSTAALLFAWLGFWAGAEPFVATLGQSQVLERTAEARAGFVIGGGNTNVRTVLRPEGFVGHLEAIGAGLAIVFVPTTILHAVTPIDVPGRRSFLALVDLDTIFLDVTIVISLLLVRKRYGTLGDAAPFALFGLVLTLLMFVLIGYTVTNFGTLWRMRTLAAVPLWVLIAALSPHSPASSIRESAKHPAVASA